MSLKLNGGFNRDDVQGLLEVKYCQVTVMVYPFICAFLSEGIGYRKDLDVTKVNCLQFERNCETYGRCSGAMSKL